MSHRPLSARIPPPSLLLGAVTWLWLLSACSSEPPVVLQSEMLETETPAWGEPQVFDYPLGPNDVVRVNVWKHPELGSSIYRANTPGTPVDASGKISLPVIGEVVAAGRTIFEVRDEIQLRLAEYLLDPRVDISLLEQNAHRFYVFGEVRKPGAFVMNRPITAIQALAMAGGYTTDADRNHIALVRGPIAEENLTLFDTENLDPLSTTPVRDGDLIFVTQRDWAEVGQAARDLVPLLQLISLPVGTARDIVLIENIRRD
ncbi:MAG: polysaccharide export protein [Planctomycetes bacterium]|nr:polysaccharide export protein [Planctomycetota bacterium]